MPRCEVRLDQELGIDLVYDTKDALELRDEYVGREMEEVVEIVVKLG
jgi:hypothetical protein